MAHSRWGLGAWILLAACSTNGGGTDSGGAAVDDGGAIANECVTYCDGMYSCIPMSSCSWVDDRAQFATECRAACESSASTMTETQVTQAIDCLHCLDARVDQGTCMGTPMLNDAVMGCGALCMTEGVLGINSRMLMTFLAPDAGTFTCADAGTP